MARQKVTIDIDDRVLMVLGSVPAAEREAINRVITSPSEMRQLAKTAGYAGTGGRYRVADVSPDLRVVFQVVPEGIKVLDLLSKRAFEDHPAAGRDVEEKPRRVKPPTPIKSA
jgi:hypothetical protein